MADADAGSATGAASPDATRALRAEGRTPPITRDRASGTATSPSPRPTVNHHATRRETMRRILARNVRLFIYDGGEAKKSASGVVIGSELTAHGATSYVLTNAHALDARGLEKPELRVTVDRPWDEAGAGPMDFLAVPVAVGQVPQMDLALVKVIGIELPAAKLATPDELVPGDEVVVAAAPFGRAISVSGGLVSHVQWNREGEATLLKTDAPIAYGASGGGVYSTHTGHLLAVVEGYRTAKVGFQVQGEKVSFDVPMPGETFAAPAPRIRAFLEQEGFGRLLRPGKPGALPALSAR